MKTSKAKFRETEGESECNERQMLDLQTTSSRLRAYRWPPQNRRSPALSDRLGVLQSSLPEHLPQIVCQLGRRHQVWQGGSDDRCL